MFDIKKKHRIFITLKNFRNYLSSFYLYPSFFFKSLKYLSFLPSRLTIFVAHHIPYTLEVSHSVSLYRHTFVDSFSQPLIQYLCLSHFFLTHTKHTYQSTSHTFFSQPLSLSVLTAVSRERGHLTYIAWPEPPLCAATSTSPSGQVMTYTLKDKVTKSSRKHVHSIQHQNSNPGIRFWLEL